MKSLFASALSILLFLFLTPICNGQDDKTLVNECYDNYVRAIRNNQGKEALDCVDSKTIEYYNKLIVLTRSADSSQITALPFMEKMMVLAVRNRASRDEILNMTGEKLFRYYVESGLVGKEQSINNRLGEITIDGTFARGEFYYKGKKTPLYFQFNKESGKWKFDLTSMFSFTTTFVKKVIENNNLTEEEFILFALESSTGKKPGNSIWKPIK